MRSLLLVLAACSCDPQHLACDDCGPGAIVDGRVYDSGLFAVSRNGIAVRAFGDHLQRLDRDLLPAGDPSHRLTDELASPRPEAVAVDDDGAVTVLFAATTTATNTPPALLVHTDRSLRRVWSFATSIPGPVIPSIVANPDLVVLLMPGSGVLAFDATNGAPRWQRPSDGTADIALAGDDTVLAGDFAGTIDLGDSHVLTTNGDRAGYLAAIGADGVTRWATAFSPEDAGATAGFDTIATGPNGELAVGGIWNGSATLLGTTFEAHDRGRSMVAMLDPAATRVEWWQEVQLFDVRSSATDGTRVILAGGYLSTTAASGSGVDWMMTSGLEQPMWVLSTSETGSYASFELEGAYAYGDVEGDDTGMAIVKLAP